MTLFLFNFIFAFVYESLCLTLWRGFLIFSIIIPLHILTNKYFTVISLVNMTIIEHIKILRLRCACYYLLFCELYSRIRTITLQYFEVLRLTYKLFSVFCSRRTSVAVVSSFCLTLTYPLYGYAFIISCLTYQMKTCGSILETGGYNQLFLHFLPFIENLIITLTQLRWAKSKSERILIAIQSIKIHWKCDSIILEISNGLAEYAEIDPTSYNLRTAKHKLRGLLKKNRDQFEPRNKEPVLQSYLDDFGVFLNSWQEFRDSKVFTSCKRLMCLVVAASVLGPLGFTYNAAAYKHVELEMLRNDMKFSSEDFVYYFLSSIHNLLTVGARIYSMGSVCAAVMGSKELDPWLINHQWLMTHHAYLNNPCGCPNINDPEGKSFSIPLYFERMTETIARGVVFMKTMSKSEAKSKTIILAKNTELLALHATLTTKRASAQTRRVPYSVLIHGTPGIGKTTFVEILFQYFASLSFPYLKTPLPSGSEFKYTRSFTEAYWNNFVSQMWCIILDDIGFMSPNIAKGGGDSSVMELISIINSMAFSPDQAAISDKGKTPLLAELVIGTANTKDFNARQYFNTPSAALRRFPYVVSIEVKDACKQDKNLQLNSAKVSDFTVDGWADCWTILFEQVHVHPDNPKDVQYTTLYSGDSIYAFLKVYSATVKRHYINGNTMDKALKSSSYKRLCSTCARVECECIVVQSDLYVDDIDAFIVKWRDNIEVDAKMYGMDFDTYVERIKAQRIKSLENPVPSFHKLHWFTEYIYVPISNLLFISISYVYPYYYCLAIVDKTASLNIPPYLSKIALSNLIDSVRRGVPSYITKELLAATFAASIFASLLYLYASYRKVIPQGEIFTKIPIKHDRETQNVYYNQEIKMCPYDIPMASKCEPIEVVENKILNNLRVVTVSYQGRTSRFRAIGLKGNFYLTTAHSLEKWLDKTDVNLVMGNPSIGVNDTITICRFDLKNNHQRHNDLLIFRVISACPRPDITKYIPATHDFKWNGDGVLLSQDAPSDKALRLDLTNFHWQTCVLRQLVSPVVGPTYKATLKLVRGTCGAPIIVRVNGKGDRSVVLCAMHCAGDQDIPAKFEYDDGECVGYSHALAMVDIRPMLDSFDSFSPLSDTTPELGYGYKSIVLQSLHFKSPLRYVRTGVAHVYGSVNTMRSNARSAVKPHLLRDYFVSRGYYVDTFKPKMNSWKPWYINLAPSLVPRSKLDGNLVDLCANAYIEDIIHGLPISELNDIHPVPLNVAINGAPAIGSMDPLPRKTSAGWPHNCSKLKFAIPDPTEEYPHGITYSKKILEEVTRIEDCYLRGERYNPLFMAHLKDEAVSQSKIDSGKLRVFSGAPLAWSIVVRKYTLGFVRVFQNNKYLFEGAPTICCQSIEWDALRKHVAKYGLDRIIAGDFGGFDIECMPPRILWAAFKVIYMLCKYAGNDEDHCMMIRGIATDIVYCFLNYNGDILHFIGKNPSGHPLTVIINCIVNSLWMRYCFVSLARKHDVDINATDFKSNVSLITYGDDNIMSSKVDWFNHTALHEQFAKLGIKYTMAVKTDVSVPFISMDKATFLKRTWLWSPEVQQYLAPLDHGSFNKMLTTWVESGVISNREQAFATICSAQYEYFFYGKEVYEEKTSMFKEVCLTEDLAPFFNKFPTWEERVEDYFNARTQGDCK